MQKAKVKMEKEDEQSNMTFQQRVMAAQNKINQLLTLSQETGQQSRIE